MLLIFLRSIAASRVSLMHKMSQVGFEVKKWLTNGYRIDTVNAVSNHTYA